MKNEKLKTENINAKAFVKGSQGESLDDFENEIKAEFGKMREQKIADSVETIKTLEARTEIAQKRKEDSEERWTLLNALHENRILPFTKPALSVLVAFGLIIAEGVLLHPVMDGWNIAEPWQQILVATLVVTALSGAFDVAVHNFNKTQKNWWLIIPFAGFSLISLAVFGWWRGKEIIFAGMQTGENEFAFNTATLTGVLVMLVTIALPVVSAIALDFGLKGLGLFWERFKARSDFQQFTKEVDENQKKLEAGREKRAAELEKIEEDREAWLSSARDSWEQGRVIGAWKLPFWQAVGLPTAVIGILIFVIVMIVGVVLIDPILADFIENAIFRVGVFVLLSAGLTGLFAMHFIRKWNRPTNEELFKQRATHWRNAENPNSLRLLETQNRPLRIGNNDEWETETIVAAR